MTDLSQYSSCNAEGRFWIELREPGCVPQRKGPYLSRTLASTLREFMAVRPTAYITVVTISHDGPDFQDGPEALQMADGRSMSTGSKHIRRTREAHASVRPGSARLPDHTRTHTARTEEA